MNTNFNELLTYRKGVKIRNKQELGNRLKFILAKEYDIIKISRWAFRIYSDNLGDLDSSMKEILEYLFSMEDDPQFEYTEEELHILAEKLINDEDDPIEQLHDIIKKNRKKN